ncbi:hypothetical protein P7B04_20590 [Sphingobium yanoikuyae]|jgi:hypothetical protein|uniref:Uncharacterized protein n=1 Tax=Sphingobium yanoikuyae TaxID=13690 RepID=A0A6M4G113_SPHYA|nr:hypothetical protein [Sphingobium yanoikuyae]MDG2515086.1 hypothetical protein [Sphingobium yanoikuyae]QJR00921.1 hypothetical protein HH800_01120 [Sphingobium yanoikuyae]
MNAPARFKQSDVSRVVKAARDAGVRDFEIEIDPNGIIRLRTLRDAPGKGNSMDKILGR